MDQSCPHCDRRLKERGCYCPFCGKQARCKSCRAVLDKGDAHCAECGTRVGEGQLTSTPHSTSPITNSNGDAKNTVEFDETPKSRSLRANLTDEAVSNLSGALGLFLGGQTNPGTRRPLRHVQTDKEQLSLPEPAQEDDKYMEAAIEADIKKDALITPAHSSDLAKTNEFFRRKGNQLQLDDSRLKASGKLDFAKRLTVLFLYAHELYGKDAVPRTELNAVLEKEGVYDSNYVSWLNNTPELRSEADGVQLKREGRDYAQKVLAEALDAELPNNWVPDTSSHTRTSRGRLNAESKEVVGASGSTPARAPKQSKAPKDVVEWVSKWKALDLKIDGHSAIKNVKLAEKGIFGLWAIRHTMGEAGKVVSRAKLASFLYEAFEIKVDDRGLETSLKNKSVHDRVLHISGTTFQITPPGITYARKLAGLPDDVT